MPENQPLNPAPRGKPTESWRVERMVQPVPGHLGEESRFSPWLVLIAVAVLTLVGATLLLFSQLPGSGSAAVSTTASPRAPVTVIRVTATVAVTPTQTRLPTPITKPYTVKKGDTLSTIAQKFGVSVDAIRTANRLTDDTIHVGDILNIPQPTPTPRAVTDLNVTSPTATNTPLVFRTPTLIGLAHSPTPVTPTTPTPTPGVVNYTVRSGDTLIAIAAIFSTTVQTIMDMNKLDGPSIRAGQPLTVPVGIWTVTPTPTLYVLPTVTPTPQFSYPAPDITRPELHPEIGVVVLTWLTPGALKVNEYYVVHISYIQSGAEKNVVQEVHEGTSWTFTPAPVGDSGPIDYSWYVVVVRGGGCGSPGAASTQPCAVSPISEKRSFTWR